MMSDECGMMNERRFLIHHSAFITHHSDRRGGLSYGTGSETDVGVLLPRLPPDAALLLLGRGLHLLRGRQLRDGRADRRRRGRPQTHADADGGRDALGAALRGLPGDSELDHL